MKRTFKFITALLLSSSIICTIIPHEIIHAQTITISKEIVSDNLYCITEICETPNSEINLFSSSQTKSGSKTQPYGMLLYMQPLPIMEVLLHVQLLL